MPIRPRLAWPLCLSLAVAVGCDRAPSSPPQPLPPPGDPSTEMQWRGLLGCADCDGIDMALQLQHAHAGTRRYELVELFLVRGGEERFLERGLWTREGQFLRLQADDGAERVFAIEADGRLSVRGLDGELPDGPPRLLAPVTQPPSP